MNNETKCGFASQMSSMVEREIEPLAPLKPLLVTAGEQPSGLIQSEKSKRTFISSFLKIARPGDSKHASR